jgi:uncharacterized repeat protein (TIGR01451 family)
LALMTAAITILAAGDGRLRAGPGAVPVCHHRTPVVVCEPPLADIYWPALVEPPVGPAPGATAAVEPPSPEPPSQDPAGPVLAIRVRVAAVVTAGQEIEYHIMVENRSTAAAHHVLVRDAMPANARMVRADPPPTSQNPELQWQLGTLDGGASREIVLVLAAAGPGDVRNCARVQFEHGQCVSTTVSRPALRLSKEGPTRAVLYDVLTYRLTVTNTGTAPAAGVFLSDTLAAGLEHSSGQSQLTWEIGALEPGASRTVDYQVVAKLAGRLCNRAAATANGGLREEALSCVQVAEAKLTLTKTGPTRRYLNMPAAYQITVSNPGTAPLANLVITDPLPPQMTFVSASSGGKLADKAVRWNVGALDPGASLTVDVVLRAQVQGRICNRASASADRGLTAHAEACTEFVGQSALLLEMVDTDDPIEVGAETSYVTVVRNQGSAPATNVRIEARVPDQLAVIRVTGPADHRKDGPLIAFQPLTLQPQTEARYVIHVKALRAGDLRFKVELKADQLTSGPVHEEESTTVYSDMPGSAPPGVRQSRSRGRH